MTKKRLEVGVVFGGTSAEHEVSWQSARNVVRAMGSDRYGPVPILIDRQGRWLLVRSEEHFSDTFPGTGENGEPEEEYFLNGTSSEEQTFKKFYQKFIGLLLEAEHPAPGGSAKGEIPVLTVEYELNVPEKLASVTFFEFNRDFYAASAVRGTGDGGWTSGAVEFLISKSQLDKAVSEALELLVPSD